MATVANSIKVTLDQAQDLVMDVLRARLVPNLVSSPGIGKSDLARQISTQQNLFLIDARLSQSDPSDMQGFPFIIDRNVERSQVRAGYVPMETFPIESDPLPVKTWKVTRDDDGKEIEVPDTYYRGWLLLLDEFNSAPLNVQAAAYKIVLDKMVGMHKLHDRVAIITAGNLATDKAIVNRQSTAMQSRLIHLEIEVCPKAWNKWADNHEVDHRVKSFIKFKPDILHKFDPNHSDMTFPCPRTWEFVSKIIKPWKDITMDKLAVLAGTVGTGAAREFYSYAQIFDEIPTIGEILRNPVSCSFGSEPSIHYAIAGLVGHHMSKDNADKLMDFIPRLGIDFQVTILRACIAKDRAIKKNQKVRAWVSLNTAELL